VTRAIHAELELTDCSGELWVNGIPIPGESRRRPGYEVSVPIQHNLVTGMNTLDLWVDVEGKPSENKTPRHALPNLTAIAVARLVEYPIGVMAAPENGKVLTTLTYKGVDDDSREAPRRRGVSVDLGMPFGPWAWEKAPVLTLDEMTLREAQAVVREIHAALFGGDGRRVYDLIRLRWEEMDRAYPGRDDAADQASHAAWIAELAQNPLHKVPLDPARHDFRLTAGGRMIECIDEDFFPSIRIAQEVEPERWVAAPYTISLARIGGKLVVVR
jgi:hypothetical protein